MSMSFMRNADGTITIACGNEELILGADGSVAVRRRETMLPPLIGDGFGHRGLVRMELPPLLGGQRQHVAIAGDDVVGDRSNRFESMLQWRDESFFQQDLSAAMLQPGRPPGTINLVPVNVPVGSAVNLGKLLDTVEQVGTQGLMRIDLLLGHDPDQR